jgi:hypothetical protein
MLCKSINSYAYTLELGLDVTSDAGTEHTEVSFVTVGVTVLPTM